MLFAYASFALACVVSVTYLLLFRELKRKQPGLFFARLPPLRSLDLMNIRAVTIGLIFFTISLLVGVIWIGEARVYAPNDARVQQMSLGGSEDPARGDLLAGLRVPDLRAPGDRRGAAGAPRGSRFSGSPASW